MMELGNLFFGNSRGNFELDRDMMRGVKEWDRLIELVSDEYGRGYYNGKYGEQYRTKSGGFKNSVFEINPYYWGTCEDQTLYESSEDGDCNTK